MQDTDAVYNLKYNVDIVVSDSCYPLGKMVLFSLLVYFFNSFASTLSTFLELIFFFPFLYAWSSNLIIAFCDYYDSSRCWTTSPW